MVSPAPSAARLRPVLTDAVTSRRADPTIPVELPLKLLLVADFTARADPRPLEDRGAIRVTTATFDKVKREHKLTSEPPVWAALARLLGQIDGQVAAAGSPTPAPDVHVELWNSSLEDLLMDFDDAPELVKGGLFKRVYGTAYYDVGGRPFGALLFAERFGVRDLPLLRNILEVAVRAHLPIVIETTAELAASEPLRALRATPAGRYLGFGAADEVAPRLAASFARTGFATGIDGIDPLWLVGARIAHCVKVIHCGSVPLWQNLEALEKRFNDWLATLTADPDDGARPFRAARVQVRPDGDRLAFDLALDKHADLVSDGGSVQMSGRLIRW